MNGRIALNDNEGTVPFFLYDRPNVQNSAYNKPDGAESSLLAKVYFHPDNIQIIQNGIRATVYRASTQQHLISEQNPDTLFVIMKSVYANHGLNQNTNITKQVEHLNNLVVEDCTKRIMGEIRGYMNYRRDISTLVKPIDRPKSTYVDKSLKYNKNDLYRQ
tara:strand:- start:1703 stop:2185 length:483 start_codon:yes stop_codon:yes gene_type:complete